MVVTLVAVAVAAAAAAAVVVAVAVVVVVVAVVAAHIRHINKTLAQTSTHFCRVASAF